MNLGWWTGILLVTTFIGTASSEGETLAEGREKSHPPVLAATSTAAFDVESLASYMDRAAARTKPRAQADTTLEVADSAGLTKLLAQLLFSLVVVVGLIYVLTFGLRKWAGRGLLSPAGPLKVLARNSVSQKSSVYLVAAFDRFLVIGESPQGLTCLSEFTDPEENRERRRLWGWETVEEPTPSFISKAASFAPLFRSHVTELEREIEQYREVRP